jgi:hypothetical protein
VLIDIADQFGCWVKNRAEKWAAPILDAPEGRRDEFVEPYSRKAKPDQVVAILIAREPARIMTAIGTAKDNRWHLQIAQRWVIQYNTYSTTSGGAGCSCGCVRTFRSPPESASISTIGSPAG